MTIKEMRERTDLTQKGFGVLLNIPKRTIEDWEAGRRKCPDYVRELIQYKLFKEEIIMNTRINYRWNNHEELDSIVTDGVYDFGDWLQDNGVMFEEDETCEGLYHVLDEYGDRTGETYHIISEEPTEEELRG